MLNVLQRSCRIASLTKFSTSSVARDKSGDANDNNDNRKKARSKLEDLLLKMASAPPEEPPKLQTSHPVKKLVDKRPIHKVKIEKIADKHTAQLVSAVKEVADELGGPDVKTTESELLHILLNNKRPDGKTIEESSLSDVISGMEVVREDEGRADQVRRLMPSRRRQSSPRKEYEYSEAPVDLFGHPRLNIFKTKDYPPPKYVMPTWSKLANKELKLLVTHPPGNIFEEMINWTENGKLWHFPIDNEQGMDEEKNVDFTQHVFLEEHLEGWCPTKGPIRQFMELVTVGLSKNPYITVQAKIEHIHWFRDYFESKKQLLTSMGALPDQLTDGKDAASEKSAS